MGRARAFCVLVVIACRTAAPPPALPAERVKPKPKPKPYDWRDDGQMTHAQGAARCAETLPDCKHRFVAWLAPPSPCAGKGTRCIEERPRPPGGWTCACNQCANEKDCPPGHYCSYGSDPCEQTEPTRCVPGTYVPQPCLPKPEPQ